MWENLNEELKLDDRLGQIGINKDGDQMQIIEYYT